MPDDKKRPGPEDGKRISVTDPSELRNWASTLGVSPQTVKDAVKQVGDSVAAVRAHLNKK